MKNDFLRFVPLAFLIGTSMSGASASEEEVGRQLFRIKWRR
jgi:hypothetical protein